MPIKATDVKPGQALMYEGSLQVVLSTDHVKPGKGPAYVQAKMKNIDTGTIKTNRLNSSDKLEDANINRAAMQFLYDSGGQGTGPFVFMDNETYDQIELSSDIIGTDQSQWLKENLDVTVMMHDTRALGIELPVSVELEITETTPQPKGATATNQLKEATVETGARVRVPPFIENGQMIKVKTETGEYLGKA
jgi:elongation factor P